MWLKWPASPRHRKLVTAALLLVPLGVMVGLVSESVTLYRIFCSVTGFGGQTRRAEVVAAKPSDRLITVRFDTNVAPGLPWDFAPEKIKVETHLGEPTLVWFRAKNLSQETITGQAAYNVTPFESALYFTKTQCFCFTEEKLGPGESARMPVVFYIDPKMTEDADLAHINAITLSYTFYRVPQPGKARDMATAEATAAQQLKEKPEPVRIPRSGLP
ncbi:MAG TPA: cytochrome c oxidase assembly protein [Alphaproteobacteria bacterium]|nr:cytochrome c oxidase assembly protein [Alphaproteobacteria bacterium]